MDEQAGERARPRVLGLALGFWFGRMRDCAWEIRRGIVIARRGMPRCRERRGEVKSNTPAVQTRMEYLWKHFLLPYPRCKVTKRFSRHRKFANLASNPSLSTHPTHQPTAPDSPPYPQSRQCRRFAHQSIPIPFHPISPCSPNQPHFHTYRTQADSHSLATPSARQ